MKKDITSTMYGNFGTYTQKYICDRDAVMSLCKQLYDPDFSTIFDKWLSNFDNNAVISLYYMPSPILDALRQIAGDAWDANTQHYIKVLDEELNTGSGSVTKIDPAWTSPRLYGGSIACQPIFYPDAGATFLDYEPFTTYELYLPLFGVTKINSEDLFYNNGYNHLARTLDIYYTVDWSQMEITVTVNSRITTATPETDNPESGQSQYQYQVFKASTSLGCQIALNGEDKDQQAMSRLASFGNIITDVGLAGMSGGLTATKVIGDVTSFLRPSRGIQTGVSGAGINAFYDDEPMLIVHRKTHPTYEEIEELHNNNGGMCMKNLNLYYKDGDITYRNCRGYTECQKPIFKSEYINDNITPSEMDEIKALMASGIYLP